MVRRMKRSLLLWLVAIWLWLDSGAMAQVLTETQVRVNVQGAVRRPGVYVVPAGSRVAEAIARAGGPKANASLDAIGLARRLVDGESCVIPTAQSASAVRRAEMALAQPARKRRVRGSRRPAVRPRLVGPIDLNRATLITLEDLPGIGPGLARDIIAARTRLGSFRNIEDLREVPGIGKKRFERLRPHVRVN